MMLSNISGMEDNSRRMELTHQEHLERLEGVVMTATAKGGKGGEARLMTWCKCGGFRTKYSNVGGTGECITNWSISAMLVPFVVILGRGSGGSCQTTHERVRCTTSASMAASSYKPRSRTILHLTV